ncbi:MAG: hypothetical protein JW774_09050 [Candidatus Aureabacteria bacterium]|nr:hypothetical protein [Candidatus Auribacterota bacterium]
MERINWIYSLCFGFGIAFLLLQFLFSFEDETDHSSEDGGAHDGHADVSHDHHGGSELHSDDLRNYASQVVQKKDVSVLFLSLLAFLRLTRKLTYFCAGFGTMGLLCNLCKVPFLEGLIASVAVGLVSVWVTSLLFKLVNPCGGKVKDSRVKNEDLVGSHAEVITKVGPDQIGEIKICLHDQLVQVYALPNNGKSVFAAGETVLVYQFDQNGNALIEAIIKE